MSKKDLNYSDNEEIHLTISFWTSAEIINETHLIDDERISEFELHNEALGHRFCEIFVILIQFDSYCKRLRAFMEANCMTGLLKEI